MNNKMIISVYTINNELLNCAIQFHFSNKIGIDSDGKF